MKRYATMNEIVYEKTVENAGKNQVILPFFCVIDFDNSWNGKFWQTGGVKLKFDTWLPTVVLKAKEV